MGSEMCIRDRDRRILSPFFIGVDIDLRYVITVLLSVFITVTLFYETQSIHVECKQNVVLF